MKRCNGLITILVLMALLVSACQPLVTPTAGAPQYAHPEALVSTAWLAAHRTDPTLRILDGRDPFANAAPQEAYAAGHIPGAVYVDVMADLTDPNGAVPMLIPPPAAFEALMGRLGIDNDTMVVLYDDAGDGWVARLWWALRYYGHDDVKLLNGGLTKWQLEDRVLETGDNTPDPATFTAQVRPELLATQADVAQAIADPNIVLIDALPAPYYLGIQSYPGFRPGHIPTALSLPGPDNLDPVNSTILPPAELRQLWQPLGLQPNQRIITYCGGGYIGAFDLFMLYQLGYAQISLYDGSLAEWATNPDLPMEMTLTPADLATVAVATDGADAFMTAGVDATMQYYADDATFQTVMFGETTTYTGKAEIRALMQSLVEQHFKLVLEPRLVEGDTVTFKALSWSDDMNALRISPLLATQVDVIQAGKVQSVMWTLSDKSADKLQAAVAAVAPATPAPALQVEVFATGAPFHGTNGIYFGPDGNLYIGCVGAQQIVVIDPESGAVIKRLGAEVGVTSPDDLVFGPDGSLYWTNLMTGDVVRLAPDGTVTKQQIALGVNPITFADDGRLFVALDFMGDALYELDPALVNPPRLLAERLGFLNAFDFGPDGYLYGPLVAQGKVVRIDVNADPVTIETVADGFATPSAVKFNAQGELYALDQGRGEVVYIDIETGEKLVIATLPVGLDNLAFNAEGRLFVSHNDQGYIFEVNADGTARTVIQGGMSASSGVAVLTQDGVETIWVASIFALNPFDAQSGKAGDFIEHNALTVAADGENLVLSSWFANVVEVWNPTTGESLAAYHDFAVPLNAIRFQGDLIVAELGTASVVRVNSADPTQRTPLLTNMAVPAGLAATADDLWVGDFATGQVLQLIADGETLAEPRTVATGLAAPEGLAVTADGRLLVVESGAQRLSAIDLATGEVTPIAEGLALGAPGWPTMPPTGTFSGVTVDAAGTIYVTGDIDNVLYRIAPPAAPTRRTHHFRQVIAE